MSKIRHFLVVLVVLFSAEVSSGASLLNGLPGATTFGDLAMNRNDDGSSNMISLPFDINFYGNTYNTFFVNNNGNVSFNSPFGGSPNRSAFPISNQPMIAPFWGDVDTTSGNVDATGIGNNVYISAANPDTVVVTWNDVGYYYDNTDRLNNFQLVLRNRADTGVGNFDIEFRYEQLQWLSRYYAGGRDQAGFDAGNTVDFYSLPGSNTDAIRNLVNESNVSPAQPGVWSFAFRNGESPGSALDNPYMPVTVDNTFNFNFNIDLSQIIFIDPVVAVGYDYVVDSGPNFASLALPSGFGDDLYDLYLWDGTDWVLDTAGLSGGTTHTLVAGVDRFRILGIESSLGIDPLDPAAFVTGLTFDAAGAVNMHMTSITFDTGPVTVPAPGSILVFGSGLMGFILFSRKNKR